MDEYFLSKEEWDTLVELGLDEHRDEVVLKKISTATKSTLTRKCVITLAWKNHNLPKSNIPSTDTIHLNTPLHSIKLKSLEGPLRSWPEARRLIWRMSSM